MNTGALKAYNTLDNLYRTGEIIYPRVDCSYIVDKPFDRYPHPEIKTTSPIKFGMYLRPLLKPYYPLNKKTALLHLSNKRICTPSNAYSTFQFIDSYFDYTLQLKYEAKTTTDVLMRQLNELENLIGITKLDFLKLRDSSYAGAKGLFPIYIKSKHKYFPAKVRKITTKKVDIESVEYGQTKNWFTAQKDFYLTTSLSGQLQYDTFDDFLSDFLSYEKNINSIMQQKRK